MGERILFTFGWLLTLLIDLIYLAILTRCNLTSRSFTRSYYYFQTHYFDNSFPNIEISSGNSLENQYVFGSGVFAVQLLNRSSRTIIEYRILSSFFFLVRFVLCFSRRNVGFFIAYFHLIFIYLFFILLVCWLLFCAYFTCKKFKKKYNSCRQLMPTQLL